MNRHDIFWKTAVRIRDAYRDHIKGEEAYAYAEDAARELQDAGLLAPDLPEPGRAWDDDEAPLMWKITDDFNSLAVVIVERLPDTPVQLETFNTVAKRLTIEQARRAAHALLAAANEAEGKK